MQVAQRIERHIPTSYLLQAAWAQGGSVMVITPVEFKKKGNSNFDMHGKTESHSRPECSVGRQVQA